MPKYSVDIQHTEEFTYQVDAKDEDEAIEIAKSLYANGEPAENEEIVSTGDVTNCEEITGG